MEFIVHEDEQSVLAKTMLEVEEPIEVGDRLTGAAGVDPVMPIGSEVALRADGSAYRMADLSTFNVDPDSFFEFSYRPTLMAMIEAVIEAEDDVGRCARTANCPCSYRLASTGSRIRERISLHLKELDRTESSAAPSSGRRQ